MNAEEKLCHNLTLSPNRAKVVRAIKDGEFFCVLFCTLH